MQKTPPPQILHVPEFALDATRTEELAQLLDLCFPETFEGRTYYKQLPHFRLLAVEKDQLRGQVAIEARVIRVGDEVVHVFGVMDLCVMDHHRKQGIGTALLSEAERIASRSGQDFMVLVTERHAWYEARGYQRVQPANARWLAIEDRQSHSLTVQSLDDCFMAKPLSRRAWPRGDIDLLGYLF